jgi:transposase-like protein
MPYATEIRKFAAEIGRHAKQRSVYLKHELANIKARKAEMEAYLHSTTLLQERLARFQPEIGGSLQCPRCWVDRETRSSLTEGPGTEKEHSFRCHKCGFDLSIPLRK